MQMIEFIMAFQRDRRIHVHFLMLPLNLFLSFSLSHVFRLSIYSYSSRSKMTLCIKLSIFKGTTQIPGHQDIAAPCLEKCSDVIHTKVI